jgi:hypothetical protein
VGGALLKGRAHGPRELTDGPLPDTAQRLVRPILWLVAINGRDAGSPKIPFYYDAWPGGNATNQHLKRQFRTKSGTIFGESTVGWTKDSFYDVLDP